MGILHIKLEGLAFARLVATNYLPNDPLINTLSQFGYFRRIDAMASFLVADANGETATADDAKQGGEKIWSAII